MTSIDSGSSALLAQSYIFVVEINDGCCGCVLI